MIQGFPAARQDATASSTTVEQASGSDRRRSDVAKNRRIAQIPHPILPLMAHMMCWAGGRLTVTEKLTHDWPTICQQAGSPFISQILLWRQPRWKDTWIHKPSLLTRGYATTTEIAGFH